MDHVATALGAALGALTRWAVARDLTGAGLVTGLVIINLAGTALLAWSRNSDSPSPTAADTNGPGLMDTGLMDTGLMNSGFVGTGFAGGLTTFSSAALLGVGGDDSIDAAVGAAVFVTLVPISVWVFRVSTRVAASTRPAAQ